MDDTMKVINLERMIPEVIRERLETLDLQEYKEAKEKAIKQARNLNNTSKTSTLDLHEDEGEIEEQKKTHGSRKRPRRRKTTSLTPGRTYWPGLEKDRAKARARARAKARASGRSTHKACARICHSTSVRRRSRN